MPIVFPQVIQVTSAEFNAAASHTVTLPAHEDGDVFVIGSMNDASSNQVIPVGWDVIGDDSVPSGRDVKVWKKKVDTDSEPNPVVTFTATNEELAYILIHIRGADGEVSIASAGGFGNKPNPPSLGGVTWGEFNNLWIAFGFTDRFLFTSSTWTDSEGFTKIDEGGTGTDTSIGMAYKEEAVDTQDPEFFNITGNRTWVAFTLCVKPLMPSELGEELVWSNASFDQDFKDYSGNGKNGTLAGGASIIAETGLTGQTHTMSFDGVDGKVSMTDHDDFTNGKTYSMWVYLDALGNHTIYQKYESTGDQRELVIGEIDNGKIRVAYSTDGTAANFGEWKTTNVELSINTWTHVAVKIDTSGSNIDIFVDGTEVASSKTSGVDPTAIFNSTSTAYLGGNTASQHWDGFIDDFRVYDRLLTSREITWLANNYGELLEPLIVATNDWVEHTSSTTHTISLPDAGDFLEGDMVLVLEGTHSSGNWTEDSGSYTLLQEGHLSGSTWEWNVWHKIAGASEGDVDITGTLAGDGAARVFIIRNAKDIEHTVGVDTPDPPSLTPSWDLDNTLWIAHYMRSSTSTGTSAPTGFINFYGSPNQEFAYATAEKTEAVLVQDPDTMKAGELYSDTVTYGIQPKRGLPPSNTITLTSDAGVFTLSGQEATFEEASVMEAELGGYVLTGNTADMLESTITALDVGSYTLSGNEADYIHDQVFLQGTQEKYQLAGMVTQLQLQDIQNFAQGFFTYTGDEAAMLLSEQLEADQGNYDLTGESSNLNVNNHLDVDTGVHILTGEEAGLDIQEASSSWFFVLQCAQ